MILWEIAEIAGHEEQAQVLRGRPYDCIGESDPVATPDFDGSFRDSFVDRMNAESAEEFTDLRFLIALGGADENFHPGDEADVNRLEGVELPPGLRRAIFLDVQMPNAASGLWRARFSRYSAMARLTASAREIFSRLARVSISSRMCWGMSIIVRINDNIQRHHISHKPGDCGGGRGGFVQDCSSI
jgi:hypothetical protein